MGLLLDQAGYKVSEVTDGVQALARIMEAKESDMPIDMAILDIHMPGMTGLELMDELARRRLPIAVMVVTGYGDRETVLELLRKGCTEYLDKPFSPKQFLDGVRNALEKYERRQMEHRNTLKRMEEDHANLTREVEGYRVKCQDIAGRMNTAVGSFENLTKIDTQGLKVKMTYRLEPFATLGGDFFGIHNTPEGCEVLLADVAGHDMGASYQAIVIKTFFDQNARNRNDGIHFFRVLNELLRNHGRNDRMATALFLGLDLQRMRLSVVSAGHPFLVRLNHGEVVPRLLYDEGDVLGLNANITLSESTFPITPKDRLVLHTDGCISSGRTDGSTGRIEHLTREMVAAYAARHRDEDLNEMAGSIWGEIKHFCRHKQNDDMLLAGIEIPA